jgi:lantibiotic modifying enzyme
VSPGYFHGWSGPALFWIDLYRHTDNADYLHLAHQAIQIDLARCIVTKNDTLEADEGWRTLPYLGNGGLGIGMAIGEYLRHEEDPDFLVADEQIFRSALYEQYAMPILTYGSAGIMLYLIHRRSYAPSEELEHGMAHHLEMLRYHAVSYEGHAAFRGNQQLRLSMDLATGSAGVLLAAASLAQHKLLLPLVPMYTDVTSLERR